MDLHATPLLTRLQRAPQFRFDHPNTFAVMSEPAIDRGTAPCESFERLSWDLHFDFPLPLSTPGVAHIPTPDIFAVELNILFQVQTECIVDRPDKIFSLVPLINADVRKFLEEPFQPLENKPVPSLQMPFEHVAENVV